MQKRNKIILCFCLVMFITLMSCCIVTATDNAANNTTTTTTQTHTQKTVKTVEKTINEENKINTQSSAQSENNTIEETDDQNAVKQNQTNAKAKIKKVSNITKTVKTADAANWTQIGTSGTYTLTSDVRVNSIKSIDGDFTLDGQGHKIWGPDDFIQYAFNAIVGINKNVIFKNIIFEDFPKVESVIRFASSQSDTTSSKSNLIIQNCTFNHVHETGSYGIINIYSLTPDRDDSRNILRASVTDTFFNGCDQTYVSSSRHRTYVTLTNVQHDGTEINQNDLGNTASYSIFSSASKQLICLVNVQDSFVNTTTILNISLFNQTYYNKGGGVWGNNITPQQSTVTFSLKDSNGNYLVDTNGNQIKDRTLNTDVDGIALVNARFPQRGIYTFEYTFPGIGNYLPVSGNRQFIIQDYVNYSVPDSIYRYYNDYPNLWVNVTNLDNEGLTSPEGSTDYDIAVLTQGVRYYIHNTNTGDYDYYTRPVINGKAVFENITGSYRIPLVNNLNSRVAYPEGYYYSYNISSQFLGNTIYTNSTNKTTVVYVYRHPTSVSIQNTSGVVSGLMGEDIELVANVRDLTGRNMVNGQNITFVYNNRVLAKAPINNNVARTTVKFNETVYGGELYAYFNDTLYLTDQTQLCENSSAVVTLNIHKLESKVETQESLEGIYNNKVKIRAIVKDTQGNPITSGVVSFKKGDTILQNVTVNSVTGVAEYDYTIGTEESVVITSFYNGSANYENSTNTTTVNRITIPTRLTIENLPGTVKVAESFNFNVKLTNLTGDSVSGQSISVKVNGETVPVSGTTGSDGMVTVSYTPSSKSDLTIVANYDTDYVYNSNTTSASISSSSVELIDTVMGIIVPDTVSVAQPFTFKVNLTNLTGDAILDKDVSVSILGDSVSVVYDTNEKLYIGTYTPHDNTNIVISASTTADKVYKAASATNNTLISDKIGLISTNLSLSFSQNNKALNPITITVTLTNRSGDNVDGLVRICENGQFIGTVDTSSSNQMTYTPSDNTTLKFSAEYRGDSHKYDFNKTETYNVPVSVLNTTLIINVPSNGIKVSEQFTFTVSLTNTTGSQPISGKDINVTVNGESVTVAYDSSQNLYVGTYTPANNNNLLFKANFTGDKVYGASYDEDSSITSSDIELIDTVMGIIVPATVNVAEPFTFNVNLTNSSGEAISGQTITVTVNNENVAVTYNSTSGLYDGVYTPKNNDSIIITASSPETTVYKAASAINNTLTSSVIGTIPTIASLTFSSPNATVFVPYTITVNLTNATTDKEVVRGNVKVYINGVLNRTVEIVDRAVSFTIIPQNNTTYEMYAVYDGDGSVYSSNQSATYTIPVNLALTTTKLSVPNTYKVNETFNFTISLTNGTTNLPDKPLIVTINDEQITNVVYDPVSGLYNASYTPANRLYDLDFKAVFEGDTQYNASYDTVSIPRSEIVLINTIIGVISPESVNVSDTLVMKFNITDEYGQKLRASMLDVYIVGEKVTGVVEGDYLVVSYPTTNETVLPVSVEFIDHDGVHHDSSTDFVVHVVKIPTTTRMTIVNNTAGNVIINVSVVGANNVNVTDGNITVLANGHQYDIVALNGQKVVTIPLTELTTYGNFTIYVDYSGNNTYHSSSAVSISPIEILPQIITFNLTANESVYVTEVVNITGQIRDGFNQPIANRNIIVRVFDEEGHVDPETVTTDSNGVYTRLYNTYKIGFYIVTAYYGGQDGIQNTTRYTNFTVNLIPTRTVADVYNSTAGNFSISVNVTDNREGFTDNRVENGRIKVEVGTSTVYHDVTMGENIIKLPSIVNNDTVNIIVTYEANEKYNTSSTQLSQVHASIKNSNLSISASPSTQYNKTITINGTLIDELGNPIESTGKIVFTFNDSYAYTGSVTTDSEGKFSFTIRASEIGSFEVNATFTGISGEYDSSSAKATFNVTRIPTDTEVLIDDESASDLRVLFRVYNDTTRVKIGNVTLSVMGTVINVTDLAARDVEYTEFNGNVYVVKHFTEEYLEEYGITGGVTSIKAEYAGNEYYIASSDTYSGTLLDNAVVNVTVNQSSIYVDGSVNITVNVTDLEGHPIRGILTLEINDNITTGIVIDSTDNGIYSIIYQNATAGTYNVVATLSTAIYGTEFNTTSFNITKIPTRTNVSVHNDSWGNASIDVVVYDARTNTSISTGDLHIVIGNADKTTVEKNITSSVTNIPIETRYAGEFAINVVYLENEKYLSSNGLDNDSGEAVVINIQKHDANLTVNTDKDVYYVGENVTISGYLYDINTGLAISGQTVEVMIKNSTTTLATYHLTTDADGYYSVNRTSSVAGVFSVNATFEGITIASVSNVNAVNNDTTYTVTRIPTTTIVESLNDTYSNITIAVNVKGDDGLNITEGLLTIKFGESELQRPITGNITVIKLPSPSTVGTYNLNVSYPGNSKYVESNNTSGLTQVVVQNQNAVVSVFVTPSTGIVVGDDVKISGYVYDGVNNQTNLINGFVNITFVDDNNDVETEYNVRVINSYYELIRHTRYAGLINVSVSFIDDTFNNSTAKTSYTVEKIPTNTTVSVYNDTYDKVELAVTIVDARNGNPITAGKYNLTVNDDLNVEEFGQESNWINSTTFIVPIDTTNRQLRITLNYTGDSTHQNSTGKDENGNTIIEFESKNQTATLTINVNTTETYVGETVNINGTLLDGLNNVITGKINLTFTNGTHTDIKEVNVINGRYSYNRTVNMTGMVNITASYPGNETINPANNTAYYTIDKLPTKVTITIVNNTVGNLTISVQVEETYHNTILEEGNITIEYGSNIISDAKLNSTNTLFNLTSTSQAPYTVIVNYTGNYTHAFSTNNINTGLLIKQVGNLTINATKTVQVDQPVTINGSFTDGMGQNYPNKEVIIYIYNSTDSNIEQITTSTDANGKYQVTFTPNKNGTYTAETHYVGDDIVTSIITEKVTFTVDKIPTITKVTILNNTAGNVTIKVKVTDEHGNNITSGQFNVTVNNQNTTVTFTDTAEYIYKLNIIENGTHNVSVQYLGTENKYYPSNGQITKDGNSEELTNITISLQESTITIAKDAQRVYVTDNITIYGRLTDAMGNPIPDAIVNLTFVDEDNEHHYESFNITNSEGYYYYQRTTEYNGTINVTATYYGKANEINSSSANITYLVEKIDTVTYINPVNNTLGNVSIETWFINQLDVTQYIREGSFDVFVNQGETPYKSYNLKDLTPNENGRYTIALDEEFDVGENTVIVRYNGNYKYKPSHKDYTDRLYKDDIQINITLDKNETFVDNNVNVNVSMTHNNLPVEGRVNITILNSTGDVVKTISSDEYLTNGNKSFSFTNDTSDTYTIKVEFGGTNIYNALNVTKTFTLNKLPTETLVDVVSNVIGNVTISVKVNDTQNDAIVTMGSLIVTVDGQAHILNPISVNSSGITIIKLNTTGTDVMLSVRYVENHKYNQSLGINATSHEELNDIILSKQPTNITVEANPNETYIGTPITITGKLINPLGNVNNQVIHITINNTLYTVRTTNDDTGSYTFTYDEQTSKNNGNGTFTISVSYDPNTNLDANASHNSTTIKVDKIPTNSNIEILNNTVGNITVNVKVVNATDGQAVTNGTVEFYDKNGQVIGSYPITGADNIIKLDNITTSGNIEVTAKYLENNIFLASDVKDKDNNNLGNITVANKTAIILISVEEGPYTIGDSVTINGSLVDDMGENIDGIEIVDIRIDNDVYHVNVNGGKFSLVNITYTQGVKKVNATYTGNNTISPVVSDTKEFTVNLIPTKTIVTIVNTTVGSVVLNVNVTNLTDESVTTGTLKVQVGQNASREVSVNTTGTTFITLDEITLMDNVTVTVTYLANEVYNSSKGIDARTIHQQDPKEYIDINTTRHNSIMNVTVVESPVKIGQNITIQGTLVIDNGTKVDNEIVEIWIGNTKVGNATVTDGNFVYNYTTRQVTSGKVATIRYNGTELVRPTESDVTYVVEKLPTMTIIEVLNNTAGNVTINIKVNDSFNNKELNYLDDNSNSIGNLTIFIGENNIMNVTVKDTNNILLPSLTDAQPNVRVTVNFVPRDDSIVYLGSENYTVFTVISQVANITINATPNPASVGDEITITGRLTDGMNRNISNVELSYNIETYSDKITTDENGTYKFTYTPTHEGVYQVNVSYAGGGAVRATKGSINLTVNKIPTNTMVEVLNTEVENVTLRVNVTDNATNPVTSGQFNVTVQNSTWTSTTVYNITGTSTLVKIVLDQADSDYTVKVEYLGDNKYINSTGRDSQGNTDIPIHTVKDDAILNVSANPETAYVGRTVEIHIDLKDDMGNGITSMVTLNFTSEEGSEIEQVQVTDGLVVYNRTSHLAGHVNVTVNYAGNTTINPAKASTNYTILKIPTTTTLVRMVNNTVGNITLELRFADSHTGNAITSGSNFTVVLVGHPESLVTYNLDDDENDDNFNITSTGTVILKVDESFFDEHEKIPESIITFLGNGTYNSSWTLDEEELEKATINIDLETNESVYINQTVLFNVTVRDAEGVAFDAVVNITLDDELFARDVLIPSTGREFSFIKSEMGNHRIEVIYQGNELLSYATANRTVTVERIPTSTSVTLLNNTFGNVTIKVVVNDTIYNKLLSEGTLIITGGAPCNVTLTGTETIIKLNVTNVRNTNVYVRFNGTSHYQPSYGLDNETGEQFEAIDVTRQDATLTITVTPNPNHVGNESYITGKLTDGLGNNITDEIVSILINNVTYKDEVSLNASGEFNISYVGTTNGTYNISVIFGGNRYVKATSANTTLTLNKVETTTTVTLLNNSAGNVTIRVNITDEFANPVHEDTFAVNITHNDDTPIELIIPITGDTTDVLLPINDAGDYKVNVTYPGTTKYKDSIGKDESGEEITGITVTKQDVNLTVGVIRQEVYVGTNMLIQGELRNASGQPISNVNITLTFDGTESVKATTNAAGYYSYTRPTHINGNVSVVAYYEGNNKYNDATANTSYLVNKIPTNTTVAIVNNTVGNVTIDVQVINANDPLVIITNGTVNVTVNNVTTQHNLTGSVTSIKVDINNCTKANVTVVYLGNDTYANSTGVDRDTFATDNPVEFAEITADKQNATLTIVVGPSPVYVLNNVTNNGTLVDGLGNNITGKLNFTVTRDGITIVNIYNEDVIDGVYSFNRTTTAVGLINITAYYPGNSTVNPATASTVYQIELRPTVTLVNITNNTAGNVTIDVEVRDYNGTVLTEGNFTVKVQDQPDTTVQINGTRTPVKLNLTSATQYITVSVIYNGNEYYAQSTGIDMNKYLDEPSENETVTNITVEYQTAHMTIEPVANSSVGDTVIITGHLEDGMGNNIVNRNITVSIGETVLSNSTDANGDYKVYYTSTINGTFTAIATYKGNNSVNPMSVETTFNVTKLNTTTIVKVLNNTAGNVTITVNVTDERGNPVDHGEFNITIDENTPITYNITGNITTVKLDVNENTTIGINVTYLGDNQYESSKAQTVDEESGELIDFTEITTTKQDVNLTVGVIRHEIPIGTIMVISGYLTNSSGLPIANANITLTFANADSVNVTTDSNGHYTFERDTTIAGYVDVDAYYNGTSKYNNATAQTHYTVYKLPTNTTVRVVNNSAGNVLIDIVVYDMYHKGLIITNGTFNITVNNNSKLVDFTTENTTIKLDINNASKANVKVVYMGNNTYLNSTGVTLASWNTDNPEEFSEIDIEKQNPVLTLEVNETSLTVFDTIKFNGTFIDGLANNITANVSITVDNGTENYTYENVKVENGYYELNRTTQITGTINVTVIYPGNESINPLNITKTYNVEKRDTITLVQVVNDTIGNIVIDVVVKDAINNTVLTSGENAIAVSITEGIFNYTISETGVTRITVPVSDNRQLVRITVDYLGNGTYKPSLAYDNATYTEDNHETITTITVKTHNSTLTIDVTPNNSTVGTTYNISGKFTDTNATAIAGANLTININGTTYYFTTLPDGYYSVNYTSNHEGNYTVKVSYNGDDVISATSNTTTFMANKIPTNTTVYIVNSTVGNVTLKVTVTDINANPINGTLNVTIGTTTKQVTFTDGEIIIDLESMGLGIDTTEEVTAKVVYIGDNKYINSTGLDARTLSDDIPQEFGNITADKQGAVIGVDVDPTDSIIGNRYSIIGSLNDTDNNAIKYANINITVKNDTGIIYSVNVTTDRYGEFEYRNNTLPAGTYTVNVSYISSEYNYTSAEKTFTVNKINTTTEALILNSTAGNVTVRLIVNDIEGRPVITGYVNITSTDGNIIERAQLSGTNYVDIVIKSITTNDPISLVANYEGTSKYANSTNDTALGSFTINKRDVTIKAIPENTTIGNTSVKVNITDSSTGQALTNIPFNITNNNGEVIASATTGNDGTVNVNLTLPEGLYELKVVYPGNETYNAKNESFTINVTKRPSKTDANIINNTAGNVTIKVTVTDATNDNKVTSGNVTITAAGKEVGRSTLSTDGTAIIITNINTTGKFTLVATYEGNNNYTSSYDNIGTVDIVGRESNITANITNTTRGETTLNITLTDPVTGDKLNGTVIVTLPNGSKVPVTVEEGNASIPVDLPVGENNITVTYPGSDKYNSTQTTITEIVEPRSINVTANVTNTTKGNTTINITLEDPVTGDKLNGTVIVTLPNGTNITVPVVNGTGNVTVDIPVPGADVNITYPTDGTYEDYNTTIHVDVTPRSSQIDATVSNNTAGNTTITAKVTDPVTGEPIREGSVNVTKDGEVIGEAPIGTDGSVTIPVNIDTTGNYTLVVNYVPTENYTASNKTLENVEIVGRESNITVTVENNTQGNTTINITLEDPITGEDINGTVIITLPNGTEIPVNVTNGSVEVPIDVPVPGGNITVTYPGDEVHNGTNTTIPIKVTPRPSTTIASIVNNTAGSVKVKVTVKDAINDNKVTSGNVTISVDGKNLAKGQLRTDGTVVIDVPISSTGRYNIIATYEGNTNYTSSYDNIGPKDVMQRPSKVTANIANKTLGNTTLDITLKDPITNKGLTDNVIITLPDGNTRNVKVTNGKASIPVDLPVGTNNIKVTYPGNETYARSEQSLPVNVVKRGSTTTTKITNNTAANVTIEAKVTDSTTKQKVTSGSVVAIVDNVVVGRATLDKDGVAHIKTNITGTGNYNIITKYEGNVNYTSSNATNNNVKVTPRKANVTVNVTDDTHGDTKVEITITDKVTDTPIDSNVTVTLPNGTKINTTTHNGKIEVPLDLPVGNNTIKVNYPGNSTYDDEEVIININTKKRPSSTSAVLESKTSGDVVIRATVTDKLDKRVVTSGNVKVLVNGSVVGQAKLNYRGIATIPVNITKVGNYTFNVQFEGNQNYTSSSARVKDKVEARDINVKVTIENNTVTNTSVLVNVTDKITGQGVANETVTVKLPNGTTINVTTDKDGLARVETQLSSGTNTLNVTVKANDQYGSSSKTIKVNVEKINVKVTVDSVTGIVGETITLTAKVVDVYGNKVTGGNLVFKLNGRSLRTDLRFDTNDTSVYKISVKNGIVTIKLTADLYLRAGKNITASYSGSSKYNSAKANVAEANIRKRTAQVSVSVSPTLVKQNKTIVFTAKISDVTPNTSKSQVSKDAYVLFKINGNTLKDSKGQNLKVKVTNGVAKYTYRIPLGTSGMVDGHMRDYTVSAVYSSPDYYPDSRANSIYHVERSKTSIKITSATVKDDKLSIKANILDQYGYHVIGKNQVSIKINGKTFKINGKSAITVKDGVISLSGLKLGGNKVKSLTITTGERQSYYESSVTTKKVETL